MLEEKYLKLQNILDELLLSGLLVAYSGGVDSAFLLWVSLQRATTLNQNKNLKSLLAVSPSLAADEHRFAVEFAQKMKAPLEEVRSNEVEKEVYAKNDLSRCYHCKSELFELGSEVIQGCGFRNIAYGYNASDAGDHRPGHRAAQEFLVHAPLYEAGLTKNEIRELIAQKMGELGLLLKEKPASPCLSSRIMTGVRVTPEKLGQVDYLEGLLRKRGLKIFRLRLHEYADPEATEELPHSNRTNRVVRFLRLEVDPAEMLLALMHRGELTAEAQKLGFRWVTLDMGGYQRGGANVFQENIVSR